MSSTETRIVFRADGNRNLGLGHIVRCLALANMLKDCFSCIFIIREPSDRIRSLIKEQCELVSILSYTSFIEEFTDLESILLPNDILILDGYNFDEHYQVKAKQLISKLVFIDDLANFHFYADIVINHGSSLIGHEYKKESYTRLLLGFPYLLMRRPILNSIRESRVLDNPDSVFICMGGADPLNLTAKVLGAAMTCHFIKKIIVVTGSAYVGMDELHKLSTSYNKAIRLEHDVNAEQLISLIRECDIAIAPASSIALEICCVKAALITGISADNQKYVLDQLIEAECAISLGDFRNFRIDELKSILNDLRFEGDRKRFVEQQAKVIDGLSPLRLKDEFNLLVDAEI